MQKSNTRTTNWIRKGYCSQCGDCCSNKTLMSNEDKETILTACERIIIDEPKFAKYAAITAKEIIEAEGRQCKALENRKGGKRICKDYENRPAFCKDFPAEPNDIRNLKNCTYFFIQKE